jgi:hypothetical protein
MRVTLAVIAVIAIVVVLWLTSSRTKIDFVPPTVQPPVHGMTAK